MVVVEPEEVVKEQWRVPPIKDNQTVDIFTEPEYFQVLIVLCKALSKIRAPMSFSVGCHYFNLRELFLSLTL